MVERLEGILNEDCVGRVSLLFLRLPTSDFVRNRELQFPLGSQLRVGVEDCGDIVNGGGEKGIGDTGNCGPDAIPVTCLQKVAMARKQNFAGVVNEKRTGRTWAASGENCSVKISNQGVDVKKNTHRRKLADELGWDRNVPLFRRVEDTSVEFRLLYDISMDLLLYVP